MPEIRLFGGGPDATGYSTGNADTLDLALIEITLGRKRLGP
jgi:hypothetical protein